MGVSKRLSRADRVFGVASAKSVKRGQRPRPRRGAQVSASKAMLGRAGARFGEWVDRWAERASERHATGPGTGLIGLDVASPPSRLRTSSWAPVIAAVVVGAMFLAVLRMDVIRMRFAVAQTFEEEMRLEELKRELTVEMRRLRDPALLAQRAEKLGFRRAERLIDLDAGSGSYPREGKPRASQPVELASAAGRTGQRP